MNLIMSIAKLDSNGVRVEKWAAIDGEWKFTKHLAKYLGPSDRDRRPPVGMARASARFRDGELLLKVKLSRNERTTAGVFVRFQSPDAPYAVAQIGGFDRAYAISEYHPGLGWFSRATAGTKSKCPSPDNQSD